MILCQACRMKAAAEAVGLCGDCLRRLPPEAAVPSSHGNSRKAFALPSSPPRDPCGRTCRICDNHCRLGPGERGDCGIRRNEKGRLRTVNPPRTSLAHIYRDPLPTNCSAAWFCEGSKERGLNLAVFMYGCNFDCLFCQNHSHKRLTGGPGSYGRRSRLCRPLPRSAMCLLFRGIAGTPTSLRSSGERTYPQGRKKLQADLLGMEWLRSSRFGQESREYFGNERGDGEI